MATTNPMRQDNRTARSAFTLVELLVTVTIIVILSSVVLFGMSGVQKMAKTQRAKAQVARIHEMLAEKWETLDTRRIPPPFTAVPDWAVDLGFTPATWPAMDRLRKLRELARMEMPDRASDILYYRSGAPAQVRSPDLWVSAPADLTYFYTFVANHAASWQNPADANHWGNQYASAECLYMIVSRIEVGDASALEFFTEKEIGDKDSDGLPEIHDPWGNPILFIRWPTGFTRSMLQLVPGSSVNIPYDRNLVPPDPFDISAVDGTGYFYFSLIVSCGPDGEPDLAMKYESNGAQINYSVPVNGNNNNPFEWFGLPSDRWHMGAIRDTNQDGTDNSIDNIHNHFIETSTR